MLYNSDVVCIDRNIKIKLGEIILYKIAVCDDDKNMRDSIAAMLGSHNRASELAITYTESCEDLLDMLMDGRSFDLIIIDIMSGRMDGIRLGRTLRLELNNNMTQILYISDEQHHAMQLFDLRPLNFMVKPLSRRKLLSCVDTAMELCSSADGCLDFAINHTEYMIPFREIRFVESSNKQVIVHSVSGDFSYYGKLDEVNVSEDFVRIHKSYLVNSRYVRLLRSDSVSLDGEVLPISRSYRRAVRDRFMQSC